MDFFMKKVLLFMLLSLITMINVDAVNGVNASDSRAIAMGYDIDDQQYGTVMAYDAVDSFAYWDGKSIGYAEIEQAVYEDQTDSDYNLVIYYVTVKSYDRDIGFLDRYYGATDYVTIESDVDDAFVNYGYGYYASANGYEMKQPSPQPIAKVEEYTIGIDIGQETKVSGSVPIEIKELEVETYHDSAYEIFNVGYDYSCNLFDCSYMNKETYQKATFLVDKTDVTPNSYRASFINNTTMTVTFRDNGIWGYRPVVIEIPIGVTYF